MFRNTILAIATSWRATCTAAIGLALAAELASEATNHRAIDSRAGLGLPGSVTSAPRSPTDGNTLRADATRAACPGYISFTRVPADTIDADPGPGLSDTVVVRYGVKQSKLGGPACILWDPDSTTFDIKQGTQSIASSFTQTRNTGTTGAYFEARGVVTFSTRVTDLHAKFDAVDNSGNPLTLTADHDVVAWRKFSLTASALPTNPDTADTDNSTVAQFRVKSLGRRAIMASVSCSESGAVRCASWSTASVTLALGDSATVGLTAQSVQSGLGTVALSITQPPHDSIATPASAAASQQLQVRAQKLSLEPTAGSRQARAACPTVGAGVGSAVQCGDLIYAHVLPGYRTRNVLRQVTLLYSSATAAPTPVVSVDLTTFAQQAADRFRVRVFQPGVGTPLAERWFDAAGVDSSEIRRRRFSLPIDAVAAGLGTGIHPVRVEVLRRTGGVTVDSVSDTTNLLVVDRRHSPFGAGWWIAGIERLYPNQPGNRVLLVGADGSAVVFTPNGSGGYTSAPGEYSRLAPAGTGFVRTLPGNRVKIWFRSSGLVDSVTDNNPDRNVARYVWASGGPDGTVLDSIIDSRGKAITFGRDVAGRVQSINVPSINTVALKQHAITGGGAVLDTIVDPDGYRIRFGYDASRRMTASRARRSGEFGYGYDITGRVSQITPPAMSSPAPVRFVTSWQRAGAAAGSMGTSESAPAAAALRDTVRQRVYWSRSLIEPATTVTDQVVFLVGPSWAPTLASSPDGNTVAFDRDSVGQAVRVRTAAGADVRQVWDGRGNLVKSIQVLRGTSWTSRSAVREDTTRYEYHPTWDAVSRIIPPDTLEQVSIVYDGYGRRSTMTNARGHVTVFGYRGDGQLQQITEPHPISGGSNPDSLPTVFTYDSVSGNLTFAGKGGRGPTYVYDTLHRSDVVRVEAPDATTTFTYDVLKRVTKTDGKGEVVEMEYRDTSSVMRRKDARGAVTAYSYDALGRMVQECRAGGQCYGTVFGDGMNATELTSPGVTLHQRYDERGLLAWRGVYGDTARFAYDQFGRQRMASNRQGWVERMYDTYGRPTCELQALKKVGDTLGVMTVTARHDFDRSGRRQRTYLAADNGRATPPCTGKYPHVLREHDELDRGVDPYDPATWTIVALPPRADSVVVRGDTVGYQYDRNGNLISLYHGIFAKGHSGSATWSWQYDAKDRAKQLTMPTASPGVPLGWQFNGMDDLVFHGGAAVLDTLAYDAAGRVFSRSTSAGPRRFTYDVRARIDSELVNGVLDRRNQYDVLGNIAHDGKQLFRYDSLPWSTNYGRLLESEHLGTSNVVKYAYDTRGNTTRSGSGVWAAGQALTPSSGDREMTYDAWDRMTSSSATLQNTECSTPGTRTEKRDFRYDALGRRVMLVSYDECASDRGVWRYFWLDDHVAVKLWNTLGSAGTVDATSDQIEPQVGARGHWYVYGPGTDRVLGMWNPTYAPGPGLPASTRFAFVADFRGSVVRTYCELRSGSTANCSNYNTGTNYSAYGSAESSVRHAPGYNGLESSGGLVYMRNRWYDPNTGRFTQEDPIGFAGGSNLYAYAGNDPVTFSDPFGLWPCEDDEEECSLGDLIGGAIRAKGRELIRAGGEMAESVKSGLKSLAKEVAIQGGLALATGGLSAEAQGTVTLFRAVSKTEAADIAATGVLRAVGSSAEGKYFATTAADAAKWGQKMIGEGFQIVKAEFPAATAKAMHHWNRLDAIGPAYFANIEQLKSAVVSFVR